jgi:hypothetical protein
MALSLSPEAREFIGRTSKLEAVQSARRQPLQAEAFYRCE